MRHIAVLALASFTLASSACNSSPATDEAQTEPPTSQDAVGTSGNAAAPVTARVAEIVGEPATYFGKTVTVEADVEEVFGPMAFALDEDAPLEGGVDRDLLVLSKKAGKLADIDDQWLNNRVRVTGSVGRMTVVEVEREIGWDLNPEIEAEVERAGAILIASAVDRVNQ